MFSSKPLKVRKSLLLSVLFTQTWKVQTQLYFAYKQILLYHSTDLLLSSYVLLKLLEQQFSYLFM